MIEIDEDFDGVEQLFHWLAVARTLKRGDHAYPLLGRRSFC